MRKLPKLWSGSARIQWGCALLQLAGETTLNHLPVVLSGLRSVETSLQLRGHASAVQVTRRILGDLVTKRAVQNAVYAMLDDEKIVPSFQIEPSSLAFHQVDLYDADVAQALEILATHLDYEPETRPLASTDKDLVVPLDAESQLRFRFNGLRFPQPQQHEIDRRPRRPVEFSWDDLRSLAEELDASDALDTSRSESWCRRLAAMTLESARNETFGAARSLRIDGLQHLIGLPGAGKTTLLCLICILCARRGLRVAVFFPAIEVAREHLQRMNRYGVAAGIIVGRSLETHRGHINRLAELIGSTGNGGFARDVVGVDLFAQSCSLPAFSSEWPSDWPEGFAPCQRITEASKPRIKQLCPAWPLCGRVKNQRTLVTAPVWVGHVLSADTAVPAHTSAQQWRFFELIASTFDLIIVDEVDEAQRMLDEYGALSRMLTGDDESLHIELQKLTGTLAANRGKISEGALRYIITANEFERHMLWFIAAVRNLQRLHPDVANRYEDNLLTANFLLRESLKAAALPDNEVSNDRLGALSDFWESAMYSAFFDRDQDAPAWPNSDKYAPLLGLTVQVAAAAWQELNRSLKRYLAADHHSAVERHVHACIEVLCLVVAPGMQDEIAPHVRMLIATGFTIAAYQRLAKMARPLAHRGEISDGLVPWRASGELRMQVPRSVLGTFSAVRFRRASTGQGLEIDYLVMDSNPRTLLHRLHTLKDVASANVLLTSATSWFNPSSQYHVGIRPKYLLKRSSSDTSEVRMYFSPRPHPGTGEMLRFSGAGRESENNLRFMVESLVTRGAAGTSDIERTIFASETASGKRRKAALIVNSYAQVELVVKAIQKHNPELAERTRGVVRVRPSSDQTSYCMRGEVESLGPDLGVDIIVFPIGALGRGVNVVFKDNEEDGKGAIGSVFFLTRPHPGAGDLGLLTSMLARATEQLDAEDFSSLSLKDVASRYNSARYRAFHRVTRLLARPLSFSQLDGYTLRTFAANMLVPVMQTIGRGTRGGMSVEVYFVDAAWAPKSARGETETQRSSVLVTMRNVLRECLRASDPIDRHVYQSVLGPFSEPFENIDGVLYPSSSDFESESAGLPASSWALEDGDELMDAVGDAERIDESEDRDEDEEWTET